MSVFRIYDDRIDGFGNDGYPLAWHSEIKHLVRVQAGNRCVRCGHPYEKGAGEWSPCDAGCTHGGPIRYRFVDESWCDWGWVADVGWRARDILSPLGNIAAQVEARWRILTVHHLNGVKADCRWHNLIAACQRCHLNMQRRVVMDRPWPWPHNDWFKPYAAAYYAATILGEELTREEAEARLDELLALGARESSVERMPL